MKKVILVIVSLICIAALTACASSPAQHSAAASVSASQSAAASQSVAPAPASSAAAESAAPTESTSANASAEASASAPAGTGVSLEQIAAAMNQSNSAENANGDKITAVASGNTLTITETVGQDMSPASFPSGMQATYNTILQAAIDKMASQDPEMPSSTWVMIIQNKSGEQLAKITANYTAK